MRAITIKLSTPVQLGENSEPITELVLKPTARAFRDFSLATKGDGGAVFQLYELAKIGMRMASQPAPLLDKMDPADMMELAGAVMGFLGTPLTIGSTP